MTGLLNNTEATALALHSMVILAGHKDELVTTRQLAKVLQASENHLAKIMQQLGKKNLVISTRGPSGGFKINRSLTEITLREVFEAIGGELMPLSCLFRHPVCNGSSCILGQTIRELHQRMYDYFSQTTLEELKQNPLAKKELVWQT